MHPAHRYIWPIRLIGHTISGLIALVTLPKAYKADLARQTALVDPLTPTERSAVEMYKRLRR
jgi:hypothetical protein